MACSSQGCQVLRDKPGFLVGVQGCLAVLLIQVYRHRSDQGIDIHLFVRENKLAAGKAAPFTYHGRVLYESHRGSQPISVVFGLQSGTS